MSTSKVCTQCGAEFGPEQRFCPNDGSPLRPHGGTDSLIGQVIADRYQILELLGEGGMGRVYLAEHVRMGRRSAVKVMSPNLALAADAISRFNREAANASRINHPNVAQIYDFGETADGVLYLAMEFIEGDTLTTIVEREGAMTVHRAAQITKQVGDALGAAHHMGIVHRDLKPDNVMIARHIDGSDWVKVVDFGIAKTVQGSGEGKASQTVTTAGVSLGTPEYMSPEQLAGERLDNRTDIYSLGLVCFNLLTADLPYPRVTSKETLVRRLTSKPRTLAEVRPGGDWPASLQAALDRALAPEPADRYASAAEFGRDVMAAAADMADPARTVRMTPIKVTPPLAVPVTRPAAKGPEPGLTRKVEEPVAATSPKRRRVAPVVLMTAVAAAAAAASAVFVASRDRGSAAPLASSAPAAAESTLATTPASSTPPPVAPVSAPAKPPAAQSLKSTVPAQPAPPTTVTARDSTPPSASVTAAAPQRLANPARGGVFRHPFLRANGDSGPIVEFPPNATDQQRMGIMRQDILGHLGRMNAALIAADLPKARAEIREVGPVVRMFHQLYPNAPETRQVENNLRIANAKAMAACRAVVADSAAKVPANFRCEQLFDFRGPGQRGRGANRPPK